MKHTTKKIGLAILSLSLAAVLTSSVTLQIPVQNMQNGNNGNMHVGSAFSTANAVDVSDKYLSGLDNSQFINNNLVDAAMSLNSESDGTRRIIVEFESQSQLDLYLESSKLQQSYDDFSAYVNAPVGKSYASVLEDEQNSFIKALNRTSISYEYRHGYTSILNAISIEVNSKDVATISKIDGVKNIILSEVYAQPTVEPTINVVDVYGTGIYDSSDVADRYSGNGMLVAVLDSGFDVAHNAFKTMPPAGTEKLVYSDVEAIFDRLNASETGASKNITAEDVYYNAKVPFAYDYADKDADVFAIANSHGVHVAGIIAGQDDSVTAEDGKAFKDGTKFMGVAPNAQLMIGKVFSDHNTEKGAQTDDILAAVADCVIVGADVINMSLGMSCGFSREEDANKTNEVYDKVYAAGINLVVAAGNESSSGMGGAYGSTNLTSNPDSATVGSPSTYFSSLSVASISGQKSSYMQLEDGTAVYFNESSMASGQQGKFVEELLNGAKEKSFNFVVVPGYGRPSNYNTNVKAQLAKGNCIAVVSRGETSFEEKQKAAYDNGAVACIIYNNMSGKISASLGTGKKIPTCTVSAAIGKRFTTLGTGKIYLNETYKAGPFMSDFSSWGPTNDLRIKPEITAHGGEITSAVVGGYAINSGTSMASPNMAGAVALLRQHVSENYGLTGVALANRVNHLLMSTATIVYDENGLPYAVRKQGAGLGDIGKAINTDAFLYVENSSKTKLELGDDPAKTGVYTMHFRVKNTSDKTKTYSLDVLAMTESVSIDNITVEEKAHMFENAQKNFYVNGQSVGNTLTLESGADVEITATLALSASDKQYMNENFENGMYVEGFVVLKDTDSESAVDLSIPYLAFYGDWEEAPHFDKSLYEVSKDKYDSSIKDEDKVVAAIYESVAIGRAYKEYNQGDNDFILPLGQYLYTMENDADPGIEASVDKIAIGNSEYGIFEFYGMYMGMLRAVGEMDVAVTNAATGELVFSHKEYNVRKSHNAGPSVVEFNVSGYDLGLMNNEKYTITMTAYIDEGVTETKEFGFYVDYQSPMIKSSQVRYEDNGDGTRKAFLDLEIYDNHYPQSVQLFVPLSDTEADFLMQYPIPIKNSVRDGISKVSINITDYMENFTGKLNGAYSQTGGEYANMIGVRIDDYALNASAYLISPNTTIVDEVEFNYTYKDSTNKEVMASLRNETMVLRPNQSIDLSKDMVTIETATGSVSGKMSTSMVNYTAFICENKDAHGVACGFTYYETAAFTYTKGQYYYDAETGTVLRKEADDTEPTYDAYTRFYDIIAEPVVKNGSRYEQPDSKHFVCPACGAEEVFTFNARTGKITTKTFKCAVQDPMIYDVEFTTSNKNVVQVNNGFLYAAGVGTATITAKPSHWTDDSNNFVFNVKVEGDAMPLFLEELTVGAYDNHTKEVSRDVTGGAISVDCGTELTLYPSFKPWYVTSVADLTWEVSDSDVAEIVSSSPESARVICKKPGGVSILLSSPANGLIGTFTIIIGEEFNLTSYYFREYKGIGYSETYKDEKGNDRKMLVIPANLGIYVMGMYASSANYDGTFEDLKTLDTVVVPQGVNSIGSYCFRNTSIRRIYLPSSIEHISTSAFSGCTNLEEVYWYDAGEDSDSGIEYDADNNTYNWDVFYANASEKCTATRIVVQYSAFANCSKLKVFDFSRVTAAFNGAFSGCKLIEHVDLTNLRYAGSSIFNNCSGLKTVTLHDDTVLASGAFANTSIEEITFGGSIVADGAFKNMKKLESIVFTNNVETIGANAFEGCTSLSSIEFNGTCLKIGASAFKGCTALTEFTIPAGVEKIGDKAFENCSNLAKIYVDSESNIQEVGFNVFTGCSVLKSVEVVGNGAEDKYASVTSGNYTMLTNANGTAAILTPPAYPFATAGNVFTVPTTVGETTVKEISKYAYANSASLNGKEVIIPEGIETIGYGAFRNTGITKVVVPSTVTKIDPYAFAECPNLETVILLCDLEEIPAYAFYNSKNLANVQLPGSVKTIGDYAFMATCIRSVYIGENVESIGFEAFRDCASLVELNFAEQSTLKVIGQAAFSGCRSLQKVIMPDTVEVLKYSAFVGCYALTEVYVSAGLQVMEDYAFSACPVLTTFTMGDGAKMLGNYAFYTPGTTKDSFYYHNSLANVTIPDSVESIGAYAFAGNAVMEEITLNGVTEIGLGAFMYTTGLNRLTHKGELKRIGANAFIGSAIRNIDLEDVEYFGAQAFLGTNFRINNTAGKLTLNAIEIGAGAFYNCSNIKQLNLTRVEVLGDMAFASEQQGSITKIDSLGNQLVSMGATVFYNQLISSISLPETLKEIGEPAFVGCASLQVISVAAKNKTFFVDEQLTSANKKVYGLYKKLTNGTYELVAVPNNTRMEKIDDGYQEGKDFDYTNLEPFKILEGTSRISAWAMGHCKYIHAVEIPASVKTIGPYAFFNMGYGVLENNQQLAAESRVPFTKFIFKGLQAPILETSYNEESAALDKMYATFVYTAGYLMSDMVIPVNAKGFESLIYQMFFMEKHYSEELIESSTQSLLDWLTALDVDALTAADEAVVNEMNMIYFIMSESQKTFISEELTNKLTAAVEKIAQLKA